MTLQCAPSSRLHATAGGNDERAARTLGVSLGSARLAKRRHLHAARRDLNASFQAVRAPPTPARLISSVGTPSTTRPDK